MVDYVYALNPPEGVQQQYSQRPKGGATACFDGRFTTYGHLSTKRS